MPRSQPEYPPGSTLYADLREKWKQEDELINQRVTWLLNSQAFLLGAFGVLAKLRLEIEAASGNLFELADNNLWILFGLGEALITGSALVVTFFLREGIFAAIGAMRAIKSQLIEHKRHHRVWRGIKVDVLKGTTTAGTSPSKALANTFSAVWLICLCYEVYRNCSFIIQLIGVSKLKP